MWRCDLPTRLVLAAVAGLAAAALSHPLLALLGAVPWRPRLLLAAVGLLAAVWGTARVGQLEHRALRPGGFAGVVVVTGRPSGDRAIARVQAAREDVLVRAPGHRPQLGGVYRVSGRLVPVDPVVRAYYATQGVHLELRTSRLTSLGSRGGLWGAVDRIHAAAVDRLGAGHDPPPARSLVAGVTLGEDGAMPPDVRQEFRDSGLYHLVAVSGQNVALVVLFALVCLGAAGVVGTPARIAATALTILYVLVTGAGPSIVRAGVAGALVSVAWLSSRPVARWHLLACGAAVVGVWVEKGMGLVIPGFIPSPLGEMVEYSPSLNETLICLGIWALGLLCYTLFLRMSVPILQGRLSQANEPAPRSVR